jgi:hypothetical protein
VISRAILEQSHPRAIAMREAIDKMKDAANEVRLVTHQLLDIEAYGASDVAAKALFELHQAGHVLEQQYQTLLEAGL